MWKWEAEQCSNEVIPHEVVGLTGSLLALKGKESTSQRMWSTFLSCRRQENMLCCSASRKDHSLAAICETHMDLWTPELKICKFPLFMILHLDSLAYNSNICPKAHGPLGCENEKMLSTRQHSDRWPSQKMVLGEGVTICAMQLFCNCFQTQHAKLRVSAV